jgi:putative spermidine/putrescine transport system permease protein
MNSRQTLGVASWAAAAIGLLGILTPLAVVVAASFNSDRLVFPPEGFSLDSYVELLHSEQFLQSAYVSLYVAAFASVAATAVGLTAAVWMRLSRSRLAAVLTSAILAPLFVPGVLVGLSLYALLRPLADALPVWTLIIGHLFVVMPFPFRIIVGRLNRLSETVDEAARLVGCGTVRLVLRVLLPSIAPAVFAGGLLAFIMSWEDFNVSLFLAPSSMQTLPVQIYSYVQFQFEPVLAAVSVGLMVLAGIAVLLLNRVAGLSLTRRPN